MRTQNGWASVNEAQFFRNSNNAYNRRTGSINPSEGQTFKRRKKRNVDWKKFYIQAAFWFN